MHPDRTGEKDFGGSKRGEDPGLVGGRKRKQTGTQRVRHRRNEKKSVQSPQWRTFKFPPRKLKYLVVGGSSTQKGGTW